jgi:hypothetical protein
VNGRLDWTGPSNNPRHLHQITSIILQSSLLRSEMVAETKSPCRSSYRRGGCECECGKYVAVHIPCACVAQHIDRSADGCSIFRTQQVDRFPGLLHVSIENTAELADYSASCSSDLVTDYFESGTMWQWGTTHHCSLPSSSLQVLIFFVASRLLRSRRRRS